MPTTYAGYAPRREGDEGTLDIGKAFGGAIETIETAQKEEKKRREKLTSIYDKNVAAIESYEQGKSTNFNNWMQEQTTKIKGKIAADFKLLKQGKTTDSDYRRKNSNINSGWSMLAKKAKSWNDDMAAGIKADQSPFGNWLTADTSEISDFKDLDIFMSDIGTLSLGKVDANGLLIAGSETPLATILAPENSIDESINVPEELIAWNKKLPKATYLDATGKLVTDPTLAKDRNKIKAGIVGVYSKDTRTLAKLKAGLNPGEANKFYKTEGQREKNIADHMNSLETQLVIQAKITELMAADTTKTEDDARAEAEAEQRGIAHMNNMAVELNVNKIKNPVFEGNTITAKEAVTIRSQYIDKHGNVQHEIHTYAAGEEIPIGELQSNTTKAQIYDELDAYAGHVEGKPPTPRPAPDGDKADEDAANISFYKTVANAAAWDTEGYKEASGGKIIEITKADNGKSGKDYRVIMEIVNKDTTVDEIFYPVKKDQNGNTIMKDGKPVLWVEKMEEYLADRLQGGKPKSGSIRFGKGKKLSGGTYVATPGKPKETPKYTRVSGTDAVVIENKSYGYENFITGTKKDRRIKNSDEAMQMIIRDLGTFEKAGPDIEEYARLFGRIPASALNIDKETGGGGTDTVTLTVTRSDGTTHTVDFITDSKKDDTTSATANKIKMDEIAEFYHHGTAAAPPTSTPKEGDEKPLKGGGTAIFKNGKWVKKI